MELIVNLIFDIFTSIISLLPTSPFLIMMNNVEEIPVLGIVNWFIPFDNCVLCLEAWLAAMACYLIVKNIDKILDTFSIVNSVL